MTADELRKHIADLIRKPPRPASIATVDSVREFKKCVQNAQKARTMERLQSTFNQLRSYY